MCDIVFPIISTVLNQFITNSNFAGKKAFYRCIHVEINVIFYCILNSLL